MTTQKLFEKACKDAEFITQEIPIDVRLQFYALYKQATRDVSFIPFSYTTDIRSAFKMNACLQVSKMTKEQAQKAYIELVTKYLKDRPKNK